MKTAQDISHIQGCIDRCPNRNIDTNTTLVGWRVVEGDLIVYGYAGWPYLQIEHLITSCTLSPFSALSLLSDFTVGLTSGLRAYVCKQGKQYTWPQGSFFGSLRYLNSSRQSGQRSTSPNPAIACCYHLLFVTPLKNELFTSRGSSTKTASLILHKTETT